MATLAKDIRNYFNYLSWNEEEKCFIRDSYKHVYLQPANHCQVHGEQVEKCNPAYWEKEDLSDKEALEEDEFRVDSETGECMSAGWYYADISGYIGNEERAEALCQRLWGQSITEAYEECEEEFEDNDCFYYTEW